MASLVGLFTEAAALPAQRETRGRKPEYHHFEQGPGVIKRLLGVGSVDRQHQGAGDIPARHCISIFPEKTQQARRAAASARCR